MGDQFEKFIKDHRMDFDDQPNTSRIWEKIDQGMNRKKTRDYSILWKIAAMLLLFTTVTLLIERSYNSENNSMDQYAEFKKAESFYTQLIVEKKREIESFKGVELTDQFRADIERLDKSYDQLKETFNKTATDQKLVDAMIENLQLRINILNQQLSILKRLNQAKNENENTSEI